MTTDDSTDLLTYVHPADGSVVPDEITHDALRAAVSVFMSRQISPAAAVSSWHARDHFTQAWVASAATRQKPVRFDEWLATMQTPANSKRMEAAAKVWDDAQAAAAKVVMDRIPGMQIDTWVFERVPSPEKRQNAAVRRREQRF